MQNRKISKFHLNGALNLGSKTDVLEGRVAQAGGVVKGIVVKVFKPQYACIGAELREFLSELHWARELRSPLFPRIIELGESEGDYFIAMERIDGWTMSEVLRSLSLTQMAIPVEAVFWIGHQLAAGLHHLSLHQKNSGLAGVVHRGINPSNVILEKIGLVRLVDFGHTLSVGAMANPMNGNTYAAPESREEHRVEEHADVYAIGKLMEHLSSCTVDGESKEDLRALYSKATDADPSKRYISAKALQDAIKYIAESHGLSLKKESCNVITRELFGRTPGRLDPRARRPQTNVPFRMESEEKETAFTYRVERESVDNSSLYKNTQGSVGPIVTKEFELSPIESQVAETPRSPKKFVDEDLVVTAFAQREAPPPKFVDQHLAVTAFSVAPEENTETSTETISVPSVSERGPAQTLEVQNKGELPVVNRKK